MYSCTMAVPDPRGGGGGGGGAGGTEEDVGVLKKFFRELYVGEVWGVLGWFGVFQWTARRLC